MSFDPGGVGVNNGGIFGFPFSEEDANIILIPVPFDATASYKKGTAYGPENILSASVQLDFYHPLLEGNSLPKVHMLEISQEWLSLNQTFNDDLKGYFYALENGKDITPYKTHVSRLNMAQDHLAKQLQAFVQTFLDKGKKVGLIGGEHSIPLGFMRALKKHHGNYGILQIDAHADLRVAYEGFTQSHASIMHNVLEESLTECLVAVGVRDLSAEEHMVYEKDKRTILFSDWKLKNEEARGRNWNDMCAEIVSKLPQKVYISFDIDGLDPSNCPNTGTPVPGGLSYSQAYILMKAVVDSGKTIIGFDLCEVACDDSNWDGNVGARILWEICVLLGN